MKAKRFFAILLTLCMILAAVPLSAAPVYATGTGTAADPYQIGTKADLEKFRDIVNGTNGETQNTAACAILTADINLGNAAWTPIGSVIAGDTTTTYNKYTGTFDGNDHTISGLFINAADSNYQGLFGYVDKAGVVRGVGVVSGSVTGRTFVGGVAARNDGTVENCYSVIDVNGKHCVGGVVGQNTSSGKVQNCYNTGAVSASNREDDTTPMVGGVVGRNFQATVDLCYNTGAVTCTGPNATSGGVVGQNTSSGKVQNCYNTGDVSGTGGNYFVGGVVGESVGNSKVSGCLNTGDVTASSSSTSTLLIDAAGGVVGYSYGESGFVRNCYNTGGVSGTSVGSSADIGGVVGYLGSKGKTENCYNTGSVSSTAAISKVGGVAGGFSTSATLTNCYYLKSSAQAGVGDNNAAATGFEAADLTDKESFAGFDFTDVWYLGAPGPGLRVFGVDAYLPGSGTANDPYRIGDADQLFKFADIVNGTNGQAKNQSACAVLTADIDITGRPWTPIGGEDNYFEGVFDGAGHTVTGMSVSGENSVGFIGVLSQKNAAPNESGVLKDLWLENVSVEGTGENAGGAVGSNRTGIVRRVVVTGMVIGHHNTGGVAGRNDGTVENCLVIGDIDVAGSNQGGIVAQNDGIVRFCRFSGDVPYGEGSIVRYNGDTVTSCYYDSEECDISAIGYNQGTVSNVDGLTQEESKDPANFAGWDFTDTWYIGNYPDEWQRGEAGPALRVFGVDLYFPGSGTAADPYQISNADQLFKFADIVNGTNGETENPFACAVLTADIDLNNAPWTPMALFGGTFDGADYAITNLNINTGDKDNVGLFGQVQSGTIKDLTVSGSVTCTYNSAGLSAGGLAGTLFGSIVEGCSFNGTVTGSAGSTAVGGLAGTVMNSDVTGCRSSGMVSVTSTSTSSTYAGGLAGFIDYNQSNTVESCYTTATVTANNGVPFAGGFAGYISFYGDSSVRNCYATGDATAQGGIDRSAGGFAGDIDFHSSGSVETCYCLGLPTAVNGGSELGFYGRCSELDRVVNCLWVQGTPDNYSTTLIKVTEEDLKKISTFSLHGFDLDTVWRFISGVSTKAELWAFIPHYVVTVTPAANMTNVSNDIGDAQAVAIYSAMKSVRYRADNGFYFPSDYAVAAVNGISVTRKDRITLDVTGQPTDDAAIVLAASTALPSITTQPADATPPFGNTAATLTVAATADGHTLAYQWYSNTTAANTGGTAVSGAESASYTLPADLNAGTYYYYCVVTATHSTGGDVTTLTSDVATVTVDPKLVGYTGSTEIHWPYTGAAQEKTFTIDGYTLLKADDYTVTYTKGGTQVSEMKDAGTYVANYECKGNYTGEWTITFIIEPVTEEAPVDAAFTATGADTGTLSGLTDGGQYTVTGAATASFTLTGATSYDLTGVTAGTLSVVKNGDGSNTLDSDAKTIDVTQADAPANLGTTVCTSYANNDGKITGVDATMEYRKDGDNDWTAITGDTVTDLASGKYAVRVKAAGTVLASEAVEVTIDGYVAPYTPPVTEINSDGWITATELKQLIEEDEPLTVKSEDGAAVTFGTEAIEGVLEQLPNQQFGTVTISLEQTTVEDVEIPGLAQPGQTASSDQSGTQPGQTTEPSDETFPAPVAYTLDVTAGGRTIEDFGGTATLELPYDLPEDLNPDRVTVWKAVTGEDGETGGYEKVESSYDPETGTVAASVDGSGTYVVGYVPFPYTDVPENAYYYEAVDWADVMGITEGKDETTFDPEGTTSRAEMVTFLWRAAGCPEPTIASCPFTDVDPDAYYYKAVLWAYEKGITEGVGDNLFDPDGDCDRAQAVTFLFRAFGTEADGNIPFTDVSPEEYYANAVRWAYANGITEGVSDDLFDPDGDCLRAHTVTFLYRTYRKNKNETQGGTDQ